MLKKDFYGNVTFEAGEGARRAFYQGIYAFKTPIFGGAENGVRQV